MPFSKTAATAGPPVAELRRLVLSQPFRIAHGASSERLVLRLRQGEGIGEAPFVPYYPDTAEEVLEWLAQREPNREWTQEEEVAAPGVVRLAADVLRHDLLAKRHNMPVWRLLKQPDPRGMRACRSLGIPSDLQEFSEQVRRFSGQFDVFKLKLGSGNPYFDEAIVAAAREAAPRALFFGDVNGGWSVTEAAVLLPKMQRLGLAFVEQPVHHAGGMEVWRELQAALPFHTLPLYADESVQTVADLRKFAGLVQGVNIKLLKFGGFSGALELLAVARELGCGTLLGSMIESSIGVTAAAHLAGGFDWIDLDGHLYLENDDFEGLFYDPEGRLVMPAGPGIGVQARRGMTFS
jgi:L-Ala-D/L-Glu epimerase